MLEIVVAHLLIGGVENQVPIILGQPALREFGEPVVELCRLNRTLSERPSHDGEEA